MRMVWHRESIIPRSASVKKGGMQIKIRRCERDGSKLADIEKKERVRETINERMNKRKRWNSVRRGGRKKEEDNESLRDRQKEI